jgi:hypothetical protein
MSSQERMRFPTKDGDVEALEVLDFCSRVFQRLSYQLKLLYIKLFGDAFPL